MNRFLLFTIIFMIVFSIDNFAQTAPNNFSFTTRVAEDFTYQINGYGNNYSTTTNYTLVFGYNSAGVRSNDVLLTKFEISGKEYSPITLASGECYDKVVVNRVANSNVTDMDKQTLFYEKSSTSGTTNYFTPSYTEVQEAVNTRIMNRGGDNVFSNSGSETLNNIERIDLIISHGVFCVDKTSAGFLVNERGGNDNFKIAAITALDVDGKVSALGNLVSVSSSDWGNTGKSVVTAVFQRGSTDSEMRPNQNLSSQNIYGVFVSYDDLGINNNVNIYGVALFPGDVTAAMDLIGLTGQPGLTKVPTNTVGSGNGGLDLMGGGGYFGSEDNQVVDMQVELTADKEYANDGDPVKLTVFINNNGPTDDNNIEVITTIPDGFTYNSIEPGYDGLITVVGNTVTWTFNSLEVDFNKSFVINATANSNLNRIFNSTVTSDLTDIVPQNNDDTKDISKRSNLPISLIDFYAVNNNNGVELYWETATEINNDYFEILKSFDNVNYNSIAIIDGAGNSNITNKYFTIDNVEFNNIVYYKLKQTDFDGTSTTFDVIVLEPNISDKVNIYPNPNNGVFNINGLQLDDIVEVYNANGMLVNRFMNNTSDFRISLIEFGKGIYFLNIISANGSTVKKLIVN